MAGETHRYIKAHSKKKKSRTTLLWNLYSSRNGGRMWATYSGSGIIGNKNKINCCSDRSRKWEEDVKGLSLLKPLSFHSNYTFHKIITVPLNSWKISNFAELLSKLTDGTEDEEGRARKTLFLSKHITSFLEDFMIKSLFRTCLFITNADTAYHSPQDWISVPGPFCSGLPRCWRTCSLPSTAPCCYQPKGWAKPASWWAHSHCYCLI